VKKRLLVIGAVVIVGFLALGAAGILMARSANPLEAVRRQAIELGDWEEDELATLGGGYSNHFLKWRAHGTFRPASDPAAEVYVEIEKAAPFLAWKLVTYRVDREPR
jgi:hypothetical protein